MRSLLVRTILLTAIFNMLALGRSARADFPIFFPWAHSGNAISAAPVTVPTYRTLGKVDSQSKHAQPQPIVLETTAPRQIYAYGWFGSNPTPSWGRHFGTNKNYTQWTRR